MEEGDGEMPFEKQELAGKQGQAQDEIDGAQAPNGGEGGQEKVKGAKPDYRVVQPQTNKDGKTYFADVGALWRNTSKSGKSFYTLKIGKLRLLVFENNRE